MDPYGPSFWEVLSFSVVPALISALSVFAGVFFAILLSGRRLISRLKPRAREIVRERCARGELSRQEFEQMRDVLEK